MRPGGATWSGEEREEGGTVEGGEEEGAGASGEPQHADGLTERNRGRTELQPEASQTGFRGQGQRQGKGRARARHRRRGSGAEVLGGRCCQGRPDRLSPPNAAGRAGGTRNPSSSLRARGDAPPPHCASAQPLPGCRPARRQCAAPPPPPRAWRQSRAGARRASQPRGRSCDLCARDVPG